ncbi:glucokinase [SAR86 cluster bacterium]|nr:glucokinase [SAR86 cluster bacterium]
MKKVLLVDIGGTNIRYAYSNDLDFKLTEAKQEPIENTNELDKALFNLLAPKEADISALVISAAGPKFNNSIKMTNRDYSIDSEHLKSKYGIESVHILNDWEAIAYSFAQISDKDSTIIKKGNQFNNNSLFIGPGTGLGASVLIDGKTVLATELGNTNLSTDALLKNYELINYSNLNNLEDALSGKGLSKIYSYLHNKSISSEEIFELARKGDQISIDIISAFIKTLANVLSDLSLTFLPGKGIYIVGSLARSLVEFIKLKEFNEMFLFKKSNSHLEILNAIEICVVTKEHMSLYGNLNYFNLIQKGLI